MQGIYLVPIEKIGSACGPMYFQWRDSPDGIVCNWGMMIYGFVPSALLVAKNISDVDHAGLIANADVFYFPDNLDGPVDQDVQPFFEDINLPTDWLTPATRWRELLRQVAGMFLFNQRFAGIAAVETGEPHSIFDTATLSTRLRQMTADEQRWFLAVVESFGYDPAVINDNAQLRLLIKAAGNFWTGQTFYIGGVEF